MKIIKWGLEKTKIVEYFNLTLDVPEWTNYLAVNSETTNIWAFIDIPVSSDEYGVWYGEHGPFEQTKKLGLVDLEGLDWKTTLRKVS